MVADPGLGSDDIQDSRRDVPWMGACETDSRRTDRGDPLQELGEVAEFRAVRSVGIDVLPEKKNLWIAGADLAADFGDDSLGGATPHWAARERNDAVSAEIGAAFGDGHHCRISACSMVRDLVNRPIGTGERP